MEYRNSKQKEVVVNIECGETSSHGIVDIGSDRNKRGKKSLSKLVSGVIGFRDSNNGDNGIESDGVSGGLVSNAYNTIESFIDKNPGGQHSQELVPLVGKDHEEDKWRAGKGKKAPKPPRPPRGPSLDASDMRLVREISRTANKKRERVERMRALKKMKEAKSSAAPLPSPSPSQSSSPSPSVPSSASISSGATISAMVISILFFLVIVFQAFGSRSSPNVSFAGAPRPSPHTTDPENHGNSYRI